MEPSSWIVTAQGLAGLLLTLVSAIVGAIIWLVRQRRGVSAEIAETRREVEQDLGDTHSRLRMVEDSVHELRRAQDAVEYRISAVPNAEQLGQMHQDMARLSGRLDVMVESLRGQSEIMTRIEKVMNRHEEWLTKTLTGAK